MTSNDDKCRAAFNVEFPDYADLDNPTADTPADARSTLYVWKTAWNTALSGVVTGDASARKDEGLSDTKADCIQHSPAINTLISKMREAWENAPFDDKIPYQVGRKHGLYTNLEIARKHVAASHASPSEDLLQKPLSLVIDHLAISWVGSAEHEEFVNDVEKAIKPYLKQQPADQWPDISTAPRDGTEILLYAPDSTEQIVKGYRSDEDGDREWWPTDITTLGGSPYDDVEFTHWHPLPAPPLTKKEGK